jgi:preprotein translocase subunit SecD
LRKNLGKILLIFLPIVAALVLLYPTYNASQLEKMEEEARSKAKKAKSSADSLRILNEFKAKYGADLQQAKNQKLKLGLDLRGGMYVTLEVDVIKLLEESAQKEAVDDIFKEVISATNKQTLVNDENALEVFKKNFDAIARPKGKTLINYYDVSTLKEVSEDKILESLKSKVDGAIEQAQQVIRQRIDKFGVSEPNIQLQGNRRILLELPGVNDQESVRDLISKTARLEFKLVRNNQEIVKAFRKIDEVLKATSNPSVAALVADTTNQNSSTASNTNSSNTSGNPYEGMSKEKASQEFLRDHQFTTLFATFFVQGKGENARSDQYQYLQEPPTGEYFFRIDKDSVAKMQEILNRPQIKNLVPFDLEVVIGAKKLDYGAKSKEEIYEFFALKKEPELMGDVISEARKNVDPTTNGWVVNMGMTSEGGEKWGRITGANVGKRIAIVLDGRVYSAPNVINKITGGNSQIMGMANAEEANLLEIVLKAGALQAPVKIIEERVVGASLGEDSINAGINASLVAFGLVVLFMVVYYKQGGLIADLAVLINVLLILGIMAVLGGTLSLPGIAGIILTIGMAVDANILVYERVREELSHGKSIRASIDEGFKRAFNAILDSNVNSFATGLILFLFGTGFIQGFALTLMIGILTTLFTAIIVSKAMILLTLKDGANSYSFGQTGNI